MATWTLVMILVWVECYSHWGTSPASKTIFIYIYRSWFIIPITNIYIEAGFIKPCYYHDILVFHSPCLGWLLHPLGFYAKHLIFEKYFGAKSTSSRFIETSQTVSWYFTKSGLLAHNRYPKCWIVYLHEKVKNGHIDKRKWIGRYTPDSAHRSMVYVIYKPGRNPTPNA